MAVEGQGGKRGLDGQTGNSGVGGTRPTIDSGIRRAGVDLGATPQIPATIETRRQPIPPGGSLKGRIYPTATAEGPRNGGDGEGPKVSPDKPTPSDTGVEPTLPPRVSESRAGGEPPEVTEEPVSGKPDVPQPPAERKKTSAPLTTPPVSVMIEIISGWRAEQYRSEHDGTEPPPDEVRRWKREYFRVAGEEIPEDLNVHPEVLRVEPKDFMLQGRDVIEQPALGDRFQLPSIEFIISKRTEWRKKLYRNDHEGKEPPNDVVREWIEVDYAKAGRKVPEGILPGSPTTTDGDAQQTVSAPPGDVIHHPGDDTDESMVDETPPARPALSVVPAITLEEGQEEVLPEARGVTAESGQPYDPAAKAQALIGEFQRSAADDEPGRRLLKYGYLLSLFKELELPPPEDLVEGFRETSTFLSQGIGESHGIGVINTQIKMAKLAANISPESEKAEMDKARQLIEVGEFVEDEFSIPELTRNELRGNIAILYAQTGYIDTARAIADQMDYVEFNTGDSDLDGILRSSLVEIQASIYTAMLHRERVDTPIFSPGEESLTLVDAEELVGSLEKKTNPEDNISRDALLKALADRYMDEPSASHYPQAEAHILDISESDMALIQLFQLGRTYAANGDKLGVARIQNAYLARIGKSTDAVRSFTLDEFSRVIVDGYMEAGEKAMQTGDTTKAERDVTNAMDKIRTIKDPQERSIAARNGLKSYGILTDADKNELYEIIGETRSEFRTMAMQNLADIYTEDPPPAAEKERLNAEIDASAVSVRADRTLSPEKRQEYLLDLAVAQIDIGGNQLFQTVKEEIGESVLSEYVYHKLFEGQVKTGDTEGALHTLEDIKVTDWDIDVIRVLPANETLFTTVQNRLISPETKLTDSQRVILLRSLVEKQISYGMDTEVTLRAFENIVRNLEGPRKDAYMIQLIRLSEQSARNTQE